MRLDPIYSLLPAPLQDAACGVYGFRLNRRRYSGDYERREQEAFERERWSAPLLSQFVNARLRRVVEHAAISVPYYRTLFAGLHLDWREIRTTADLAALPVLNKRTVQERSAEFVSERRRELASATVHTSGTTGAGLVFPMSLEGEREQWAACWRYRRRFGVTRETWYAHFFGKSVVPFARRRPPFWRVNGPGRQILFSAYHMSPCHLPAYLDELNRRRPPMIQGYPSLLFLLADFMAANGLRLAYQPLAVMSSSETLLPHQRRVIERAFGIPCRQLYSLTEGVASIAECPHGRLHVDEDYAHLEFPPLGGAENACRVIGTTLTNLAFPLLRYDTGDIVEFEPSAGPCSCGRSGRIVERIDGRIEDYVLTPDGRKIGRLDHIFKDMVRIRECQIVQNDLSQLTFHVVRGRGYSDADEAALLAEARRRLGPLIRIEITYQEALQRTSRGKLRFVVSDIPESRVAHEDDLASRSTNR
jgi:phenylacetate-CoA ligase